ncbi:HlyD family secretion protein [Poseidonibacter lekithochrous]|uniref:HlyD family secretion protein n=1 Tax=Poseidonibacter TaxID=2321187 RepID=UPI001C0A5C70|nr:MULTISPECIES: HlyD family secretion protein [Poseidonibacter]MBU3015529.1 HlyD family secretion protein [Poseidonibacter lekithochrous]MDO6828828.1 HlyD family secretion protein [Poseidonibacter sp. 1_MG-2023]
MKILILCFILFNAVFAAEYYAKLEPIESYKVKAAVAGKVIFSNTDIEGFNANNSTIVELDSTVNQMDLQQSRSKLKFIDEMITIETNNYNRLKKVSSKSAFEKDTQKLKVINLKSSKADMIIKIENLKDTIKNKKLIEKSNYISMISVKEGDYVSPGTLLYESKDLSKAKLEIFVPILEAEKLKDKTVYLDGSKSDVKINKIFNIADSQNISSYKVELLVPNVKTFSRLVKIEFK